MNKKKQIQIMHENLKTMREEIAFLRRSRVETFRNAGAIAEAQKRMKELQLCNGQTGASIARITSIARDYDAQISELKKQMEASNAVARQ